MWNKISFIIKAYVLRRESAPNKKFVHSLNLLVGESLTVKYGQLKIAMSPALKFAFTFSVVIIMSGFSVGVYADQSASVTEIHPLYRIKRNIEGVREILAVTPQKKAEIKIKKAVVRLKEAETMEKNNQVAERALRDAEENLTEAAKITGKLQTKNRDRLILKIEKLDNSRADRIEKLIEKKDKNLAKAIKRSIGDESLLDGQNLNIESIDEATVRENQIDNHVRLVKKMMDAEDED